MSEESNAANEQLIEAEVASDMPKHELALRQQQPITNPLDLEPAMFKAGLDRRKENRKSLMDWVRSALVVDVDFGKIHTMSKSKCDKGKHCNNPYHFSKPSLFKPGAEKICGMLGVTPTFPTIKDYESASISGVSIKTIVLRCEIVNSSGQTVAVGIGARSLEQDYGDMNKALKMAEKSAHIDATLRMAGLSEIFTQDIEDMPGMAKDKPEPPIPPSRATQGPAASPAKPSAQPAPSRAKIPPSVATRRAKFIQNLEEGEVLERGTQFLIDLGWLMPNEPIGKMEDRYVPVTKEHYLAFLQKMTAWSVSGKAEKPYEPGDYIGSTPEQDVPQKPVEVPRDENCDCNSPNAPWRSFPVPFGKHAGTKLAELDKNVLYGFCANYKPEKTWVNREGKTIKTKPEKLAKDQKFRDMLNEAAAHYDFKYDQDDPDDKPY